MNAKSMTASWQRLSLDRRASAHDRVAQPRRHLGFREPLVVGAEVEETERIGRAQLLILLGERARIGELLDPLACPDREVVPALRADPERLLRARRPGSASRSRGRCSGAPCPRPARPDACSRPRRRRDPASGGHALDLRGASQKPAATRSRVASASVPVGRELPGDADSGDGRAAGNVAQKRFDLVDRRSVGLGDENVDLARIEDVQVECHVGGSTCRERSVERVVDARPRAMNSTSGGSRFRAPTSAASSAATTPLSRIIRNGIPQRFPDGEVSGVFRSPWASIQTTAEAIESPRRARTPRPRACSSTRRARSVARATLRLMASSAPRASRARSRRPRDTGAEATRRRPSGRHPSPRRAAPGATRLRTRSHTCGIRIRRRPRPR